MVSDFYPSTTMVDFRIGVRRLVSGRQLCLLISWFSLAFSSRQAFALGIFGCTTGAEQATISNVRACGGTPPFYSSFTAQRQECVFGYLYNGWENRGNPVDYPCSRRCLAFPPGLIIYTRQRPGDPLLGMLNDRNGYAPGFLEFFMGNGQSPPAPEILNTYAMPPAICLTGNDGSANPDLTLRLIKQKMQEACQLSTSMCNPQVSAVACPYCITLLSDGQNLSSEQRTEWLQKCRTGRGLSW